MIYQAVAALTDYAVRTGLVDEVERVWTINTLLGELGLDSW